MRYANAAKIRNGGGLIRRIKVEIKMKAQQQSDTDSHIAISGEVTVNLQSIPVYSHQILETGIKGRIIKDTLHEVDTDIIGNDCFLEQTGENKENPPPEHLLRNENGFRICGIKSRARTIGPATSCGKKDT